MKENEGGRKVKEGRKEGRNKDFKDGRVSNFKRDGERDEGEEEGEGRKEGKKDLTKSSRKEGCHGRKRGS